VTSTLRVPYSAQPAAGWIPWAAIAPFLAMAFAGLPAGVMVVLLSQADLMNAKGPVGVAGTAAFTLLAFPLMALVVWAWLRFVERRPLATIGLLRPARWRAFAQGHALGMVSLLVVLGAIAAFGGYRVDEVLPAPPSPRAWAAAAILLLGFAVQSSVEEIVFRGWLLSALARRIQRPLAIGLTSLVFAALHLSSEQHALGMLNTFLFSVFLCCWALRVDHIWGVMGWHAGWNWLLNTGFALSLSGAEPLDPALLLKLTDAGPQWLTGGSYGPEGSVVTLVLLVIASAALVFARPRARAAA
jgi:membrane protease YdiL (CAAX protease family)